MKPPRTFRAQGEGGPGTYQVWARDTDPTKDSLCSILDRILRCGAGVIIEPGVRIFNPTNIRIGERTKICHDAILDGYHTGPGLRIGTGSWIGPQAIINAAFGVTIGNDVGVGPRVVILTSRHEMRLDPEQPIMHGELVGAGVHLGAGCDIGAGAIILPGVWIGMGAQVGAGAVVTDNVEDNDIVAGVPARRIGSREDW